MNQIEECLLSAYGSLRIRSALSRREDYAFAVDELSRVARGIKVRGKDEKGLVLLSSGGNSAALCHGL